MARSLYAARAHRLTDKGAKLKLVIEAMEKEQARPPPPPTPSKWKPTVASAPPPQARPKKAKAPVDMQPVVTPLYRRSTVGEAVTNALTQLVASEDFTASMVLQTMESFDKAIQTKLGELKSQQPKSASVPLCHGHLHTYRHYDDIWQGYVQSPSFQPPHPNHADLEFAAEQPAVKFVATECSHTPAPSTLVA